MNRINRSLACAAIAVAVVALQSGDRPARAQELFRDPQFGVRVTEGIVYGTGTVRAADGSLQEMELLLDLYEPAGPDVPDALPGILLYHGGDWWGGSRQKPGSTPVVTAPMFAERGYVAASVDYRLIPDLPVVSSDFAEGVAMAVAAGVPRWYAEGIAASLEDARTAYRYLVDNAETLHVDLSRIAMGGASAGGGMTTFWAYFVDDYGVTDLISIGATFVHTGHAAGPPNLPEDVEAGEPPMFLAVGEDDPTHPLEDHVRMVEWVRAAGIPAEFHQYTRTEGTGGQQLFNEVAPGVTIFDRAVEFLYFHLFASPDIDVLAGTEAEPIDPLTRGVLPVAILGSETFDVADVDRSTLAFGPNLAPRVRLQRVRKEDTNLDCFMDLVSHYRIQDSGIALGDTGACLSGETSDGISFQACDQIVTLPRKCGLGFELACLLPLRLWLARRRSVSMSPRRSGRDRATAFAG